MGSGDDLVATLRSGLQGLWIHEEQGMEEQALRDFVDVNGQRTRVTPLVRQRNEGSMSFK